MRDLCCTSRKKNTVVQLQKLVNTEIVSDETEFRLVAGQARTAGQCDLNTCVTLLHFCRLALNKRC